MKKNQILPIEVSRNKLLNLLKGEIEVAKYKSQYFRKEVKKEKDNKKRERLLTTLFVAEIEEDYLKLYYIQIKNNKKNPILYL